MISIRSVPILVLSRIWIRISGFSFGSDPYPAPDKVFFCEICIRYFLKVGSGRGFSQWSNPNPVNLMSRIRNPVKKCEVGDKKLTGGLP